MKALVLVEVPVVRAEVIEGGVEGGGGDGGTEVVMEVEVMVVVVDVEMMLVMTMITAMRSMGVWHREGGTKVGELGRTTAEA